MVKSFEIGGKLKLKHQIKYLGLTFIILIFNLDSQAQDANYWTHQYGSRSTTLGGAVIGSVLDLSGTYYNPGGLSLIEDPDVFLAAKVLEWPHYTLGSTFAEDIRINSSHINPAPSIIATMFSFEGFENHRLGISFFTRYEVKINLFNTIVSSQIPGSLAPDIKSFISDFLLQVNLAEYWGGLTWSYKVASKIGVGITQYLTYRYHLTRINLSDQFIKTDDQILLTTDGQEYNYTNYGLLWKLGITLDFDGLTFGLNATTPSVHLQGNGNSALNTTVIGEDNDGDGKQDTWATAHVQNNVISKLHTPFSIGFGATLEIKDINIYMSTEWFSAVHRFDVISPVKFESQIGGEIFYNGVTQELQDVLNIGLGLQHTFNENISVSSSFTSDFSATTPGTETNLSVASWDIYHFFLGTSVKFQKSEFTLGVGYAFGNNSYNIGKWRLSTSKFDSANSDLNEINFKYKNYKIIFGFSI